MNTPIKRIVSLVLALCMCLAMVPGIASASTGGKTQADAVAWANGHAAAGSVLDYDGAYGAQCVDLIKYYYAFLGNSAVTGNGKDYATNSLPSGWSRIQYYSGFSPQPGDVAVWTTGGGGYGHVAIVVSGDASSMTVVEQNWAGQYCSSRSGVSTSGIWGVIRPDFSQSSSGGGGGSTSGSNPKGVWDEVSGGTNSVYVRGWAYDPDDTNAALEIHVYVGGVHRGTLTANSGRPDVNSAEGCGDYHGFEGTITLDSSITGSQTVEVFALNVGGGGNSSLGQKTVTINGSGSSGSSNSKPVGNLEKITGGTLTLKLVGWAYDPDDTSKSVVLHVYVQGELVANVTANKSRKDVDDATGAGEYHGFDTTVAIPPHLAGTPYVAIHMVNIGGGSSEALTGQVVTIKADTTAPVITDVKVTDLSPTGYTVTCTVTDNCVLDRVQFPTWTLANEQDDLLDNWQNSSAASGTKNGNTYTFKVKTSDHNNEIGNYKTHIYAYDQTGNYSTASTHTVTVPAAAKSVSLNASTLNFDALGASQTLTASVLPSNAIQNVTWSVSNTSVATVSSSGVVTAVGYGTAVVTATAHNGVSADCTVTVEEPVLTGVSVATMPEKTVYTVGDTLDPTGLTLTAAYSNGTTETVTEGFDCTPTVLDTVGTQTITVTYAGFTTTFQVTVEAPPTVAEGNCGTSVTWKLDRDGTLRISGEGSMGGFSTTALPWAEYMDQILAVVVESGVTEIYSGSFQKCTALTSVHLADTVTKIGSYAFKDCTALTEVTLSAGLKQIGEWSFRNCVSLKTVDLPAGLEIIYGGAFLDCGALTELRLPDSVYFIGDHAFNGCTGLTAVTISASVTQLGSYNPFAGCTGLTAIAVEDANPNYCDVDGVVYSKDMTALLVWPAGRTGSAAIPDSVTSIGDSAFQGCGSLTGIAIPSAVTAIGNSAFHSCSGLTELEIPAGVTVIGGSAFYGCRGLTALEIPAGVTSIGTSAFSGCTGLTAFTIPAGLTVLENSIFRGCTGLTRITVPASVETIENNVFYGCTGLKEIHFTADAPEISAFAFHGVTATAYYPPDDDTWTPVIAQAYTAADITWVCSGPSTVATGYSGDLTWKLTDDGVLTFSGSGKMRNYEYKSEMPWYGYLDQVTAVVLEEGITSVGDYAFYGIPNLSHITIAESVTTIGAYAFKNCPLLDGVVLPSKLTKLGESAFYACTSLRAMEIPASLWTVQPYTFKNCTALTELTLHEGNLMKISDGAFYNTALKELTLPDCLMILDMYAFKNCAALENIILGSGLTQIREAVFYGTAIPTITIPEGVVSIGPYAFKNCTGLQTIDLPSTLTGIDEASFYACTALEMLELPDAVKKIGNYAFRKCAALQSVTFSDSLTEIGESAFYGCESLAYLNVPGNVTTIGGYAFKGCTDLVIVSLPDSLITLGDSAFYGCTTLSEFTIPVHVETVGEYCFSGSAGLRWICFLGDAPAIGTGAFSRVTAEVYYPGDNATWTASVRQNYGGTITWKAN